MTAGEIRTVARRAGIAPGVAVLDLCCGVAGPGRFITAELGCRYLGVDASPEAVALARQRTGTLDCRFEVGVVPALPPGRFDVVLLLETMLAFPDLEPLLGAVAGALPPGGRFAFTVEEGEPLTAAERASMPDADTVCLTPLPDLLDRLERSGLRPRWVREYTRAHQPMVGSLLEAYVADAEHIAAAIGPDALEGLLAAHRLWRDWFQAGRVRKFAVVAERAPGPIGPGRRG